MAETKPLRLLAESQADLEILSAAIQDSVIKAENLKYDARRRRFTIELNRYRWEHEIKTGEKARIRSILAFDGVLSVRTRAITKADPDMVMSLLNVTFKPDIDPPGGEVSLLFAGDGELALSVEALDATLLDSEYEWGTKRTPDHERRRK